MHSWKVSIFSQILSLYFNLTRQETGSDFPNAIIYYTREGSYKKTVVEKDMSLCIWIYIVRCMLLSHISVTK